MPESKKLQTLLKKVFEKSAFIILDFGENPSHSLWSAVNEGLVSADISIKEGNILFALSPEAQQEIFPTAKVNLHGASPVVSL